MKFIATTLLMLTCVAYAQNPDPSQAVFNFNQGQINLNLEQKEFETIYRTDQVPDTCYRDEVQGYRTECHTEYDTRCSTRIERVCGYQNHQVCTTVPRRVCHTENVCRTENSQVCDSRGCRNVPRRVCDPVQRCSTQNDRVCHNEQRYECDNIPRQYCEDVPRQVCQQIPNVVRVPYACTRPVQVPIGQRLKLHTIARVSANLLNFAETGQIADQLLARLSADGNVTLRPASASNAHLFQIVAQQRTEQMISATEKVVNYSFTVQATSIAKLNLMLSSQVLNHKIYTNRLEFALQTFGPGVFSAPIKGHLKVVQMKNARKGYILINDDFDARAIVAQNGTHVMMFSPFGADALLTSKNHYVELTIGVDLEALKKNLINPEALQSVLNKKIEASFEAYPI